MTTPETVPVIDDDRIAYLALNNLPSKYRTAILAGEWDNVTGMQVLARHRLTAVRDLEAKLFVHGALRCAKCNFRLTKTVLTPSGAFANDEPDTCPNCNVPMWRVTWEDEAKEAYKVAESQMDRALSAEAACRDKDVEIEGWRQKWIRSTERCRDMKHERDQLRAKLDEARELLDRAMPLPIPYPGWKSDTRAFLSRTGGEA